MAKKALWTLPGDDQEPAPPAAAKVEEPPAQVAEPAPPATKVETVEDDDRRRAQVGVGEERVVGQPERVGVGPDVVADHGGHLQASHPVRPKALDHRPTRSRCLP